MQGIPPYLILTHLVCFILGAFFMNLYESKKRGHKVNIMRSVITLIVITFFSASLYKEIFLNGTPTSPALYALFGIIQGAVFEFSVKDIIEYFKKK